MICIRNHKERNITLNQLGELTGKTYGNLPVFKIATQDFKILVFSIPTQI
jgi:hypothetical protein